MYYINLEKNFPRRYDLSKFIEFDGQVYDSLMSFMMRKIKSFKVFGYYEVLGEEGRPDLISFKIYGKTIYWWFLMIFNDLIDPEQVTIGTRLRYPSVDEIEELYFTLNNQNEAGLG